MKQNREIKTLTEIRLTFTVRKLSKTITPVKYCTWKSKRIGGGNLLRLMGFHEQQLTQLSLAGGHFSRCRTQDDAVTTMPSRASKKRITTLNGSFSIIHNNNNLFYAIISTI
ncbi:hypothetical protein CEXT_636631 [Caerostris extrusa]|uniref:Uncharacterized protein n=1 Tax=Caerostris extrusa TaxID=172846 RepID=A0AAV4QHX3_CAEEX|nr:hypothetical protein CEXT_636631 [Caerostris extrusa]